MSAGGTALAATGSMRVAHGLVVNTFGCGLHTMFGIHVAGDGMLCVRWCAVIVCVRQ